MKSGDLVLTLIKNEPVILLKQVARKVWNVLRVDGKVTSEWVLNLKPYEEGENVNCNG